MLPIETAAVAEIALVLEQGRYVPGTGGAYPTTGFALVAPDGHPLTRLEMEDGFSAAVAWWDTREAAERALQTLSSPERLAEVASRRRLEEDREAHERSYLAAHPEADELDVLCAWSEACA